MNEIEMINLADIKIANRRREDFGDIESLAESIRRFGLLHPVVVDDQLNLIAGERRIRAARLIGDMVIPARRWGTLTELERQEIELEENLRRKDLTPYERSREIVKQVEVAKQIISKEPTPIRTFSEVTSEKVRMGRPTKTNTEERAAERIGLTPRAVTNARAHVQAVEKMPALSGASQAQVLKINSKLNAMTPEKREETIEAIKRNDSDVITNLVDLPPLPNMPSAHQYAQAQMSADRWRKAIEDIRVRVNSVRDHGGIRETTKHWTHDGRQSLLAEINRLIMQLGTIRDELSEATDAA